MNIHSLVYLRCHISELKKRKHQRTQASSSQNCVAIQQHQVVKAQLLRQVPSVTEDNLINALRTHTCITSTEPRKWPQNCPWQSVMAVVERNLSEKAVCYSNRPSRHWSKLVDVDGKKKAVRTSTDDVDAHLSNGNLQVPLVMCILQ